MNIYCYGDSNTWGYDPRSLWEDRYDAGVRWCDLLGAALGCPVINGGENGRCIPATAWEQRMLGQALKKASPLSCLVILLGTNDVLMGRSAEAVVNAMEQLILRIREDWPETPVLLLSPPPLRLPEPEPGENMGRLAKGYRQLAGQYGLDFLDLQALPFTLACDGVHFSEADHRLLAGILAAELKHRLGC